MAYSKRKRPGTIDVRAAHSDQPEEVRRVLEHLQENWKLYVAGTVFLVLAIVAGILMRISAGIANREAATQYAVAVIESEEPAVQIAELQRLTERRTPWTEEQLYLLGETALQEEDYEQAEQALARLREEFPQSRHLPDATEALAFLAERRGDLEAALAGYRQVMDQWPNTFAGRRQPYNIARVHEEQGDLEGAAAAYQQQMEMFPGSQISQRADDALARLHSVHPELFPEAPAPVVTETLPAELAPGLPITPIAPEAPESPAAVELPEAQETPAPAEAESAAAPDEAAAPAPVEAEVVVEEEEMTEQEEAAPAP